MSDRTSHRRRARQQRNKQARAGIVVDCTPVRPGDGMGPCEKCPAIPPLVFEVLDDEVSL